MQTYSLASVGLAAVLVFVISYAWQPPADTTPRVAMLISTKPVTEPAVTLTPRAQVTPEAEPAVEEGPEVVNVSGNNPVELAANLNSQRIAENADLALTSEGAELMAGDFNFTGPVAPAEPELPADYDNYEPDVALRDATEITELQFSSEIDEDELIALEPTRLFSEGSYTIYATFEYDQMADGMVWSWVWRNNGRVVSGGNEVWVYGSDGPGYVFFNPQEGYNAGEYSLEVWVNGELMRQANLFVTSDIAAR